MTKRRLTINRAEAAKLEDGKSIVKVLPVTCDTSTVSGHRHQFLWNRLCGWDKACVGGPPDPLGGGNRYQFLHVPVRSSLDSKQTNPLARPRPGGKQTNPPERPYCVRPRYEPGTELYNWGMTMTVTKVEVKFVRGAWEWHHSLEKVKP